MKKLLIRIVNVEFYGGSFDLIFLDRQFLQ